MIFTVACKTPAGVSHSYHRPGGGYKNNGTDNQLTIIYTKFLTLPSLKICRYFDPHPTRSARRPLPVGEALPFAAIKCKCFECTACERRPECFPRISLAPSQSPEQT